MGDSPAEADVCGAKAVGLGGHGAADSPVRYVLIIQSNVESGPKMIQFNIQFKINSEIFIQSKNSFKS